MIPATLTHKVGAYAVQPQDYPLFTSCGFDLAMTATIQDPAPAGVAYLDTMPLKIWRPYVQQMRAKTSPLPVKLPTVQVNEIMTAIKKRVAAMAKNPAVAGFYVQDDYIGNVRDLHERIADCVHTYAPGRKVVMGMGCTLDYSNGVGGWAPAFSSRAHFRDLEMLNWTPKADAVLTYIYSFGQKAPTSDFTMAAGKQPLLPWMLSVLATSGFDPARHMLIGGPQCWEDVPPTVEQIETQCRSFAEHGAGALCAFTWGNPYDTTLRTSAQLRLGLMHGAAAARAIWNAPAK